VIYYKSNEALAKIIIGKMKGAYGLHLIGEKGKINPESMGFYRDYKFTQVPTVDMDGNRHREGLVGLRY